MGVDFQLRTYEYALSHKYNFDKLTAYTILDNKRISFKPDPEYKIKDKIGKKSKPYKKGRIRAEKNLLLQILHIPGYLRNRGIKLHSKGFYDTLRENLNK